MLIDAAEREQLLALTRAFLARFFENEITTGTDDLKTSFFWLLSFLAVPGFLLPAGMAFTWQLVAAVQGPEALRVLARGDKAFYEGFAMVACAVVSAIAWNSLLTDRRDGLILGALPVRPLIVIAARLAALGLYVALVAAAMNALSSLSFGFLLAASNTTAFALRGVLAHFVSSFAAGVCVLLSVAGGQGLVLAVLGPRRFSRISPLLQLCLVAGIVVGFLMLPVIDVSVVDALKQAGSDVRPWILAMPPVWFLGVYEWVLGTDDPVLLGFARTAVVALVAGLVATVASYPLAYRRVMVAVIEDADPGCGSGDRPARRIARRLTAWTGRAPALRAVSQFLLATLGRVERHRFVMAAAVGTAVAWGLPNWASMVSARPTTPRVDVLSLALSSMLFLVVGLRIAASLPSDYRAGWVFEVIPPSNRDARSGTERTLFALGVLPVALLFVPLYWTLWGPDVALTHMLVSLAMGVLLVEVALLRFSGMPCGRPWNPDGVNLGRWWVAYVLGFLIFTGGAPGLELMLFGHPLATGLFVSTLFISALALRSVSLRKQPVVQNDPGAFAPGDILSLN
jgi:hypothetical protein